MSSMLSYAPGLIFLTLCYAALCAASPFGTCRRCKGWGSKVRVGRFTGHLKRGRECRRCRGYGRRIRLGRRIYNIVSRLHGEGTR
jgi:DnaJ-class molecular chaperone